MLVYGGYSILLEPFSQSNTSVAIDPPDDSTVAPCLIRRDDQHLLAIKLGSDYYLDGWENRE